MFFDIFEIPSFLIGGILLPSNSSLYGRPPLPGTIYYNHFNCSDDAKSLDECNGQFADEHCYTGELDFVIQCNIGMFVVQCRVGMFYYLHN